MTVSPNLSELARLLAETEDEILKRLHAARCGVCGGLITLHPETWVSTMLEQLKTAQALVEHSQTQDTEIAQLRSDLKKAHRQRDEAQWEVASLRVTAADALLAAKPILRTDRYEQLRAKIYGVQ